ncbi:hypothetical protein ACFQO8_13840 [Exiguobacterium aestuarii]|uniref:Uncharacterized protein n=1 Tax=Exiguobacterium aestuarii TaxID=273527 RepID=A0ABW2PP92_9BACL|nr:MULTISPECIES: hypothetical protein [Exiguobacterium]MCT4787150.1 hypothetical protein [Exiguobacterium aestuarii]
MGKLSFLLAEDYIKPKIYFKSKQSSTINDIFTSEDKKYFSGLENLAQLLNAPRGFIVNAFQIDYYQSLPRLIAKSLKKSHSFKKLYILGPELSLSILKRSTKTIYETQYNGYEYINVEQDTDFVTSQCEKLIQEGHILYILPETNVCWKPQYKSESDDIPHSLCSTLLSQQLHVPILATAYENGSEKIKLFSPDSPDSYSGDLENRIFAQSEALCRLLESTKK